MPDEAADPGTVASALNERFRDAGEKVRARADIAAKTLGALGTTALGALGLAKIGDVFPFPRDDNAAQVAALFLILSFSVMAFAVAFFTYRQWRLNQPIVLASEVARMPDLKDQAEENEVARIYKEMADLNRVQSLRSYEARAHQLNEIALRVDDASAKRYRAQAEEIATEVLATQARAGLVIVRRRAAQAVTDSAAAVMYGLLAAAIVIFAISSDKLESERTSELAVAKECAAARTAKVDMLPSICASFLAAEDGGDEVTATAGEEADKALTELSAAFIRCLRAAREANEGLDECQPLRRAMTAASAG
jgi:hypothetical protein